MLVSGDIRFRFYAPEAKTVEVAGLGGGFSRDRRPMTKGPDGWWTATVSGIQPGFHYHEYFVDGNRLVNPDGLCGYGCFYAINYFDLPSDEDDFWMLKDVPHGDVRMEYYKSSVNGRIKCAWVYTSRLRLGNRALSGCLHTARRGETRRAGSGRASST